MTMSDRIVVLNQGRIEQEGTPEEIFDRPRTAFVADFIGDTNLLTGPVSEISTGHVRVELGALGFVGGTTDDQLQVGDTVSVSIRPTDVRVESADDDAAVVTDAAMIGSHISMKIASGDDVVVAHVPRGAAFSPGTAVRLSVDPDRVRVFGHGEG